MLCLRWLRLSSPLSVKRFILVCLLILTGCATPDKKIAVAPLEPSVAVVFSPDAWIRGVTQEDIDCVKSALSQVRGAYQVKHPVISLGKGSVPGGESMRAYTTLHYYDFERPVSGRWALVRCGSYNAD